MLHFVLLSPLENPWAYAVFAVDWLAKLVCIVIAILFYRQCRGAWWLLIALAFALPLLSHFVAFFLQGVPLLPYGERYPDGVLSRPSISDTAQGLTGTTGIITRTVVTHLNLDLLSPLVAAALIWAWRSERKSNAQT